MTKLVVCCDGTWSDAKAQTASLPSPTNVRKIFEAVDESQPGDQLTRYQAGVGTGDLVDKLIGGLIGVGLSEDIRDCYQWLSDKYVPGAQIYLFGFSRGAFTARSLAGMIGQFGLVDFSRHADSKRNDLVEDVYRGGYREGQDLDDAVHFHAGSRTVHFLGVFDTVGALGVPDDKEVIELADDPDAYRFHNTRLGSHVVHARHALALDEVRGSFTPTLWTDGKPSGDMKQIWFPGTHSDVGGGYAESGLSDCALKWMIDEASDCGLAFLPNAVAQINPDPDGMLHDSYTGVMKIMRSAPRAIPDLDCLTSPLADAVRQRRANPPIQQGRYLPTRKFVNNPLSVDIYAKHRWYWTGVYIEANTDYICTADGEWMDASISCTPNGTDDDEFRIGKLAHIAGNTAGLFEGIWKKLTDNEQADFFGSRRVEHADWFALIGAVANSDNPKIDGTYDPPETIVFGSSTTFRVSKPGYLYCFANDAWGFYGNNRGYVTLNISKLP